MSYYAFVLATLFEGIVFVLIMNSIRQIKREFSMLSELQVFAGLWIFFNDLALFIVIQGLSSGWF